MGKLIDLTNKTFGEWTVIEKAPSKNNQTMWLCQCSCGKKKVVNGYLLRKGGSLSCGCKRKENLIGQKLNSLTVLELTKDKKWKCQCDCGNITYVTSGNLKNGHIKQCLQCGHKSMAKKLTNDLTDQNFGFLTVIKQEPSDKQGTRWLCACKCGNYVTVHGKSLINGNTKSCGCVKSRGEEKIIKILQENNIFFQTQKSFDSCKITKHPLFFDFYIDNKYLIEFDGKQHFKQEVGWGEPLEDIQKRDNFKNQWCKNNNVPLIRIPYTRLNNLCLEDLLLETSQFIYK